MASASSATVLNSKHKVRSGYKILLHMKRILFLVLSLVVFNGYSQKPEKVHVVTHNRTSINTDMTTGSKSFLSWGVFPSTGVEYRKVMMKVTLAHPDTMPIAHWDYLDFINVKRVGGVHGSGFDVELGRMLTPYGSSFTTDWAYTWEVDITDFSLLLRDSVEIEYVHTGYEPSTLGWALTVDFEITKGPAAAEAIAIDELYKGRYPYGNPVDPIENYLKPVEVKFYPGAYFGRIRIQHTGHGYDKPKGCSEFCSRWRKVKFDGKVVDHRDMWKDCGSNPLYPQGGTWLFDRAYWCPGDLQQPDLIDIKASKGSHKVVVEMEAHEAEENFDAKEAITAYLIQYKQARNKEDVSLERIEVPSDLKAYSRKNPAGFNPVIVFRNLGSETLSGLTIRYGTKGFKKSTYKWTGSLAFNEYATVVLPGEIDFVEGKNIFEVSLLQPNGKRDAWDYDNSLSSEFTAPRQLPLSFVVHYKTNNKPSDNHLFIVNSKGDTLYERKAEECLPNVLYQDTVVLTPGRYVFEMADTAGDGLEFWAIPENGYGYIRLLNLEKTIIHHFVSDCGGGQFLSFVASDSAKPDTSVTQNAFFLYPRRTKDFIDLDAFLENNSKLNVRFLSDGVVVRSYDYPGFKEGTIRFDITDLPQGRYIVEIYSNEKLVYKNRINRD